jgi:hypothetical protein
MEMPESDNVCLPIQALPGDDEQVVNLSAWVFVRLADSLSIIGRRNSRRELRPFSKRTRSTHFRQRLETVPAAYVVYEQY